MKKVHYLIWFALFVVLSAQMWGQTQKSWKVDRKKATFQKSSPYFAGTAKSVLSLNELPTISIRKNPLQKIAASVGVENKDLYGFSMTNLIDESLTGLVKFNTANPVTVEHIGNSSEDVRAGAFANDKYYMIALEGNYPKGLYTADVTTGNLTLVADYMYNELVRGAIDMSYDYSTETMYMITNSDGVRYMTALRTVDLETGEQTVITDNMERYYRTLSVNMDGEMYGIDGDGILCKINKQTGLGTEVGSTGRFPLFFQTMEFDRVTGVLYWLCCEGSHYSELCIIDPSNATTASLGQLATGEGEQVIALHVPFKMCEPDTPAKVSDLTAVADVTGKNRVVISWTNPDKTYAGDNLTALDKVEILRNGEVVKTLTGAEPGKKSEWTDDVSIAGTYIYKLLPYNSNGAGVPKNVSVYIGHDLPAAVNNAKAIRANANSIALSWDAAAIGINNGYLDISSIRYKITRSNDHKVLAENLVETSFIDNTIKELARYTYDIEVFNDDGIGGVTTTNYVVTGPVQEIPLKADFTKETDAGLWTCVDNNGDDNTFVLMYNYSTEATEYIYSTSFALQADDWLVSPIVHLQAGKYYKVVVGAKCSDATSPEQFSIYLIKNMDIANAVKLGEDFVIDTENIVTNCRVNIDNAEGGDYAIGICCTSPASSDFFAVTAVAIEENHDGNVRGDVWDNKGNPVTGLVVSVEGTEFSAVTSDKGEFEIKNVPAGTYNLRCTKLGYKDTPYAVTIKELETKNVELNVTIRNQYTLSGIVKNEYGKVIPNTAIVVSGYNSYTAKSAENGTFKIDKVYETEDAYQVVASKTFYQSTTENTLVVTADTNIELTLKDKILPPVSANVAIEEGADVPTIQWMQPGEDITVKLYSDNFSSTFGAQDGDSHTLLGLLCKQPIVLEEINWSVLVEDEKINVVILALNEAGNVTSDILYIDEEAPNVAYEATQYKLKEHVAAPHGCFIGLSCDAGSLNLVLAGADDEYPFVPGVNGVIEDYTQSTKISFLENHIENADENFSIDYKGQLLADDEAPGVAYNVYRKDGNDIESQVNTVPSTANSLTDVAWTSLIDGTYKYSVEAVYKNNELSARTETNSIIKSITSIEDTEKMECHAEVSADGTQLLFSQQVDTAELLAIDGAMVAKDKNIIKLPLMKLGAGIYIVKMQKDNVWYTQKVLIKQ